VEDFSTGVMGIFAPALTEQSDALAQMDFNQPSGRACRKEG
jgi:hypothetical protein